MGEGVLTGRAALFDRVARAVGTPVYVYDAATIRRRYAALDAALEAIPHRILYSVKANSNLAVLALVRELGAGADIVSGGELARARRAGFAPADLVFSGVGKTESELAEAVRVGVGLINLESLGELEVLRGVAAAAGTRVAIGIRVNPDVTTTTHPYTQTGERGMKFGVPLDEVSRAASAVRGDERLELRAVGMHIGSQITDAAHYREGAEKLAALVASVRAMGIDTLRVVDVGGGLGIRYTNETPLEPAAFAAAVVPAVRDTGLALATEPGRYLVGDAGVLLTRCLYRKHSGGKEFVIVDAGMSDLLRPTLYGAEHAMQVVGAAAGAAAEVVDVVGPICESGDFLARNRRLAGAVPGALLAVLGAGAYGFGMGSHYNSRPRAAEVLLDGDCFAVVRRRETVDDLMRGERTLDEIDDWREPS